MPVKATASVKLQNRGHDTQASYDIGKSKVLVTRVFQEKDAQTLHDILVRLMKKEIEKS